MYLMKTSLLACLTLQLPQTLARCVARAQLSCDADLIPENSAERECWEITHLDWTNPTTRKASECFCHSEKGKELLESWWDCFYTRAAECPRDSEGFRTSYQIWFEETCYHRFKRRRYCNDDWKPAPPWNKIDNEAMKRNYNLSQPYQYSFDDPEKVRGVPWHGCHPKDVFDRDGKGWPRV